MINLSSFLNSLGPQFLKFGSLTMSVLVMMAAIYKHVCLPIPDFPNKQIESGSFNAF